MKTKINLLILLACIHIVSYAQYTCLTEVSPLDQSQLRSSRIGSSESFYNDFNNWIPRLTQGEPLKNPPITTIEITFHVFLDNNGSNNIFTDTEWGRNQLIWIFNHVNEIYAGYAEHENNYQKGSSDSVPGLIELPDCDTKIRFSLGENNERIYFYKNGNLNSSVSTSDFYTFIQNNYPERNTKLNVYFTAGTYSTATGFASPPSKNLNSDGYVVMCHCQDASNNYITGMCLAHELGHNLDLLHTYCGGGADVICCVGSCGEGCTVKTYDPEYLADIFGPITHSTCPHISNWGNPFDNTIPNANKITNNMMGGSCMERYISPMQAGQMYRSLALKSTRKYVKKETYSPVPLVIMTNEIWDFDLKLYRDIEIASGAVLTLASTFEFPYNGKITVHNGAALVIEGNVKLWDNNKIIVENGGILQILSGSTTELNSNAYIEIQSGAYFCITNGSTIKLQDQASAIKLKSGYINGVNTNLIKTSSCVANPAVYSTTGNGKIKDYTSDLYIQNQTITSNQYFVGKNIYIGNHVTNTQPQGNVTINNNANVIFDADENVTFDEGFECTLGSTFEVIKQQ